MSETESLHYQLCCEGAKWLRNRKNAEHYEGRGHGRRIGTRKDRAISMAKGEHWLYGQPRHYARNPHTEKWTIYDPATGIETDIFEETLGQYTMQKAACKDPNSDCLCRGQKVFDGDILADQNGHVLGRVSFTDERGWMVGVESLYDYTDRYDEKEALIIGNIHDNPYMLKGGEK